MIAEQLFKPKSIVVVGASNDITKPGGKVVKHIVDGKFQGPVYTVNPKEDMIQGLPCYRNVHELPQVVGQLVPQLLAAVVHPGGGRVLDAVSGFDDPWLFDHFMPA